MELYVWLLVWLVCTLLLTREQWQSFHSCHSQNTFQISLEENQICFLQFLIFITYISIGRWEPDVMWGFDYLFLISAEIQVNLCCNNSVIRRDSSKRGVCFTVHNADTFIFRQEWFNTWFIDNIKERIDFQ